MSPQSGNFDTTAALTTNTFSYSGYTFAGWNTAANGSGTTYGDGATVTFTQNLTLYAQWTAIPAPVESPGLTSLNWAGYVLTGQAGGYQGIGGQWTVPTLNCTVTPNGSTADWLGVNGYDSASALFQTGTSSGCQNGRQVNSAWWTDEALGYAEQNLFSVSAGDIVRAQVYQSQSGNWVYSITDVTASRSSLSTESYSGGATSAEWIAEDPESLSSGNLYQLADFGTVTFTNLTLTVPGGVWTLPSYNDAIEMKSSSGSVMALPGMISGSGSAASFTVTYE